MERIEASGATFETFVYLTFTKLRQLVASQWIQEIFPFRNSATNFLSKESLLTLFRSEMHPNYLYTGKAISGKIFIETLPIIFRLNRYSSLMIRRWWKQEYCFKNPREALLKYFAWNLTNSMQTSRQPCYKRE